MSNFNHLFLAFSGGQMYPGDFEILLEFSKGKKEIVELGTSKGIGAMVLSANGGNVTTIDNYSILDEENEVIDISGISKNTWRDSMRYFLKHWGKINTMEGDTAESAKQFLDSSIDLLYIDGDHRFYGVERDYDSWISKVKVGGIILFHDYDEAVHPDVYRFCRMKEEHDERLEVVNYETEYNTAMKIFRKVA